MKKSFIIFAVILLSLCGCSARDKKPETVTAGITFSADVKTEAGNFSLNGGIGADKSFNAVFTAPEKIKGLLLTVNGDTAAFEFMGIKYEKPVGDYPVSSLANIMLSALYGKSGDIKQNGDRLVKTGSLNGFDFELVFSKDGLPLCLTVKEPKLTVTFKNVQIKTG